MPSDNSNCDLPNPFHDPGLDLTDPEIRETAYEILIGACRSSGGSRPLTYVSSSGKSTVPTSERSLSLSSSMNSLQKSLTSATASKVKKALGLKSSKSNKKNLEGAHGETAGAGHRTKSSSSSSSTIGELMRTQMKVSEQTDSRVRRGLLRVAACQLGRKIEAIVLPLELLQQLKVSDFPSEREYDAWKKKNLKVLKAGLILCPHLPIEKKDVSVQQLRQIIRGALEKPMDTGKHSEQMQVFRNVVMTLASRSYDGLSPDVCHWADGVPLNLRLYQILLEACFDVNDETSVIDEVDEVLEAIKKTWVILGINQMLHNLCFSWVLFHRYVATGQAESDLLVAADSMLLEVEKDAKATKDSAYSRILSSTTSLMLEWVEKRLLLYHDHFYRGNIDIMQSVLSLGVSAAKILSQDTSGEYYRKKTEVDAASGAVDAYIRSSLRNAFSQERDKILSSRRSSKNQQHPLPALCVLAQSISDLAFNERDIYSPILRRWHPLATGVAVATLHACYGNELKQFVSGISELAPDAIQVLIAADKLEKDLVQMAVADSVESEDGGKSIIQEMTPYEAEAVIANLVKSWIRTRIDRLKEWVDRNLHQEAWSPQANRERFAPSAVEVLRIVDETLEAFFLLPIPMHPDLLPELISGFDTCLQSYISNAKSGCGARGTFIPTLPALTRCTTSSKLGVFKKKDRTQALQRKRSQVGTESENSFSVLQLCVRINTLHHIRKEMQNLEKKTASHLRNAGCVHDGDIVIALGKKFECSTTACVEGVQQLSEATAYKIIFHDLSHVLWDYLYRGDASSSRIEPFLQELEKNLEIVAATVHDRVRTRVITDIMRASFEGFLLVLLAGGPSRAFSLQDAAVIEEDLKFLMDLFWSNGEGLPVDLIDKFSTTLKSVLPLFHTDTESLVEQFRRVTLNNYPASNKSRLPVPPTSGHWSPTEPNTILRVLCHRNDEIASKFLKKTYNLPKKL